MNGAVERHSTGQSVYGVEQFTFTDETTGEELDFGSIIAKATLSQAAIVEEQTKATRDVLKLRQQKSEDLGKALALVNQLMTHFRTKNATSSDKSTLNCTAQELQDFKDAQAKLKQYGYTLSFSASEHEKKSGCSKKKDGTYDVEASRAVAMRGQAQVQEMLDTENNSLQQDMLSLQGFMQKRDRTYSHATELVKKFNGTADKIIKTMEQN